MLTTRSVIWLSLPSLLRTLSELGLNPPWCSFFMFFVLHCWNYTLSGCFYQGPLPKRNMVIFSHPILSRLLLLQLSTCHSTLLVSAYVYFTGRIHWRQNRCTSIPLFILKHTRQFTLFHSTNILQYRSKIVILIGCACSVYFLVQGTAFSNKTKPISYPILSRRVLVVASAVWPLDKICTLD
jgi:hypothetical protein